MIAQITPMDASLALEAFADTTSEEDSKIYHFLGCTFLFTMVVPGAFRLPMAVFGFAVRVPETTNNHMLLVFKALCM
jgi:hypothetical protein